MTVKEKFDDNGMKINFEKEIALRKFKKSYLLNVIF